MKRRVVATAAVAVAVVVLSGCSGTDPGTAAALPDQNYAAEAQSNEFDHLITKLDKALTDGHPVRGTVFKHGSFGGKSINAEWDVVKIGSDAASIFIRSRVPQKYAGDNLDTLHVAGSPYDYFLLGGKYRVLAKTPWARTRTNYGTPLNVCLIAGYQTVCDMEDAVSITRQEHVNAAKRVVHNSDGTTTLITGVTLRAILKYNFLLNVSPQIEAQFTKSMLDYQLSTRFTINDQGQLQFAEIIGVVPGATPLVVQVGYQVTGVPKASDLPQLPPSSQVTTVNYDTFNAGLRRINNS